MPAYPKEYTPEMTEDFYKSLARPIEEGTARNVGAARSEALSRGMEGDPFESLGVASARSRGTEALGDLWSDISMRGAGMAREERMGTESREDMQAFQAEQAKLGRDWTSAENVEGRKFKERMSNLEYDQYRSREALENRRGYQTELWNAGAGLLKGAVGGLF